MRRFFIITSGEHETLPRSEILASAEAEGLPFRELPGAPQVVRFEATEGAARRIFERSGYAKVLCAEYAWVDARWSEILGIAEAVPLDEVSSPFALRVLRIRGASPDLRRSEIERGLGGRIQERGGFSVDLERPRTLLLGVLTGGKFALGRVVAQRKFSEMAAREPKWKPFSHPTALHVREARCLVNLARARPGEILLDPFCGTGTILVEAYLIGCEVIGCDISPAMIAGCKRNLEHFGVDPLGLFLTDSLRFTLRGVGAIASDPPYGRSSTTAGRRARDVVEAFVSRVDEFLERGRYACLAAPDHFGLSRMIEERGYELVERHFMRVHGGLTREVCVLRVK